MVDEPAATPLERAMNLYFAAVDSGSDVRGLAHEHPDLRELLEPMIDGAAAGEPADADETVGGYHLLRELGRGGMGIVYEAWEAALDRKVAMKLISPALVADASAVARFRREAAGAGRLRHPGIVEVLQFGVDAGKHFFVMELVDGPSLHACRSRFRDVPAAVALARQVLEALQHAHERGLVHRDVKPANILIRADGRAVVTDFGLASDSSLPSLTQAGAFLGTLDYASPEQVRGESIDARADVFAVGVVLYELLSGSHPFRAATQEATMQRLLVHEPPLLHVVDARIPRDLAAIVACAMHKDRHRRYASAAAMVTDLRALQNDDEVSVRLPSVLERSRRWIRREPWRATAAALAVLGGLLAAAVGGYYAANAGNIAAGTRALADRARDDLLTEAWLVYADDPSAALQLLEAHPELAADEEAVLLCGLSWRRLGRATEADAALRRIETPATQRLRSGQASGEGGVAEGASDDPLVALVDGIILYDRAQDLSLPSVFSSAMARLQRAVLLASGPRSSFLTFLLQAAARAGDAPTFELAKAALERHFPNRPCTAQAIVSAMGSLDPKAALPMIEGLERSASAGAERARWSYAAGVCYRALRRTDDAEAAFRRCVAESPTHAQGWNYLGMVLRSAGRAPDAIAAYERAIAAAPTYARPWFNLGNVLQQQSDADGAERAYHKAIELQPGYAKPHNGLGFLYLELGRLDDAKVAFERAIAIDPQFADALTNLSLAHSRTGGFAEALPYAERAVTIQPKNHSYLLNLAIPAIRLGRTDQARATTADLVQVAAGNAPAWCERAWALLLAPAQVSEAGAAAARAVELAKGSQMALAQLAAASAAVAAGDAEAARTHLRQFEECNQEVREWEAAKVDDVRNWLQSR